MTERLSETAIMDDEGEVLPFVEGQDDDMPTNSDIIDSTYSPYDEQAERQRLIEEARDKAQAVYDQRLEEEADKLGSFDLARERLKDKGIFDPSESDREAEQATSAQMQRRQLRLADHQRQEIELGLTGDVKYRSPQAEQAIESLINAADEAFIKSQTDAGHTLEEATAKLRAKKDIQERGY